MDKIARSKENDRRDLFLKTAEKMGVYEGIIEKDFWVTWVLDGLFSSKSWHDKMIFGTPPSFESIIHTLHELEQEINILKKTEG